MSPHGKVLISVEKAMRLLEEVSVAFDSLLSHRFQIEADATDALFKKIVLTMMFRARRSFGSFKVLMDNGHHEDAVVVLRALFETLVNTKYIKASPQDRAQRFLDHWFMVVKRLHDNIKKHGGPTLPETEQELVDGKVNAIKGRYPNKNSWSDLNISKMADGNAQVKGDQCARAKGNHHVPKNSVLGGRFQAPIAPHGGRLHIVHRWPYLAASPPSWLFKLSLSR